MKKNKIYLLIALLGLVFSACEYDFEAKEITAPVERDVSFAADIKPIFEEVGCANCHYAGGAKSTPDLTPDNAYSSITSSYINSTSPENSLIYTKPSPDGSHFKKYSEEQAALILAWIEQGAQNN